MARSANPLARDTISLIARDTGERLSAPRSNSALQLAGALREIAPEANEFLTRYGEQQRARVTAEAQRAVLENAGQEFASAVRDGRLEPTQNPWFIQAYNRESAAVRATTQMADLQAQASTWEERNDPVAFQERWRREAGALASEYQGVDALTGFRAAEMQTTQQVLATNTAQNVARIRTERAQNVQQLTTQAIMDAAAAAGGNPSPAQVFAATQAAKQQWMSTGGSEAEWNQIEFGSLISAAYNTTNADLLINTLNAADREGGSLSGIAGFSDQANADAFRIRQNEMDQVQRRVQMDRAQLFDQSLTAQTWLWETYGNDLLEGRYDVQQVIDAATAQGFDSRVIGHAFGAIREAVGDSVGLMSARIQANTLDPSRAREVLTLAAEGRRNGWSAGYEDRVGDMLLSGRIGLSDAEGFVASALSRTRQMEADARSAAGGGGGGRGRGSIRSWSALNQEVSNLTAAALGGVRQTWGDTVYSGAAQQTETIEAVVRNDMRAHLGRNSGDFQGAYEAGRGTALRWMQGFDRRIAARQAGGQRTQRPSERRRQGENPRR